MLTNVKRFLGAASLLVFSVAFSFAQPQTGALQSLLGSDSVAAVAENLKFEVAAPAPVIEKGQADCPAPGKNLAPVMQDQARIKAILKLITDIYTGAHLPYSQDGVVFKNKEGRLPQQPQGFYHEYTLLTGNAPHTVVIDGKTYQVAPDLSARGSERIIIGGGKRIYYTPDHYANFIEFTMVY